MIATGIYLWYDWFLNRAQHKSPPPAWSQKEEFNRLPLACLGGPLFVSSVLNINYGYLKLTPIPPGHQSILAWLDRSSRHPLDSPCPVCPSVWRWVSADFHGSHQLRR